MAVYKEEKTNTWRVIYRYTDWTGERKQSQRRGFKTKREALAWERERLNKSTTDLDMTFASFVEQYTADMFDAPATLLRPAIDPYLPSGTKKGILYHRCFYAKPKRVYRRSVLS